MGITSSTENPKFNLRNDTEAMKALMKGGKCYDLLMESNACEDEAEKKNEDSVTKCEHVNKMWKQCFGDHLDPIIEALEPSIMAEVEPAVVSMFSEEMEALFPPKQGDAKERDDDDDVEARLREFMEGGGCKESFITAFQECTEDKTGDDDEDFSTKCLNGMMMLKKCMGAHSDYYQPILRPVNSGYQLYESLLLSKLNGGD
ncbi:unnamed protein product [Microthlaspi erraticum]|uniref:GCK domain-containing protein n=1 Tax=Microthlaspi erraticum TaxID=1685480 RepID=A0A6D2JJJ5_9BRAS|nr:unnamed protein product [Microthlaspi erraticum]